MTDPFENEPLMQQLIRDMNPPKDEAVHSQLTSASEARRDPGPVIFAVIGTIVAAMMVLFFIEQSSRQQPKWAEIKATAEAAVERENRIAEADGSRLESETQDLPYRR